MYFSQNAHLKHNLFPIGLTVRYFVNREPVSQPPEQAPNNWSRTPNQYGDYVLEKKLVRAISWQNQQNDCAPSEDSNQPGYLPSLIRVFSVRMKVASVLIYP